MRNHACFMLFVKVALGMGILVGVWEAQLDYDYYKSSCPDVENTVRKAVLGVILTDPTAPAAFLRLLFHDCQVQVFLSFGLNLCSRLSSCFVSIHVLFLCYI